MPAKPTYPWSSLPTDMGAGPSAPTDRPPAPAPSLLEPEYANDYYDFVGTKSPQAADRLLTSLKPVMSEALRSYAGPEAQSPTLQARAKILTLQAMDRYDPQRAKLRTHLLSHLRSLRRVTERATAGAYLPEQWRLDARVVNATHADLRDELGRDPSDAEISDRAKIPLVRVRSARKVPMILSSGQVGDSVPISTPQHRAWEIWCDAVYHDLAPTDQVILEHSFGLHGKPVLPANAIAAKLGLSAGAVSQRGAKIQQMLDSFEQFMGRSNSA